MESSTRLDPHYTHTHNTNLFAAQSLAFLILEPPLRYKVSVCIIRLICTTTTTRCVTHQAKKIAVPAVPYRCVLRTLTGDNWCGVTRFLMVVFFTLSLSRYLFS